MNNDVNLEVYPRSKVEIEGATFSLARLADGEKYLRISDNLAGFDGERQGEVLLCPLTPKNAAALRARLPWLRPQTLGLRKSAGCGDRLGLATPGHIRALRRVGGIALAHMLTEDGMIESEFTVTRRKARLHEKAGRLLY